MVGKAWPQELEAAAYIASIHSQKADGMITGAQLAFFLSNAAQDSSPSDGTTHT